MKYPHSHTSVSQFEQCSWQYKLQRVERALPYRESESSKWGKRVHKALEDRLKSGTPLPEEMLKWEPLAKEIEGFPAAYRAYEVPLTITTAFAACGRNHADAWFVAIPDVLLISEDETAAFLFDWKTGKREKPESRQLEQTAALVFLHYPLVEEVRGTYLWMATDNAHSFMYFRDELTTYLGRISAECALVERGIERQAFMPNPSPLCGWCAASREQCKFAPLEGERRG